MKNTAFLASILFILVSCAQIKTDSKAPVESAPAVEAENKAKSLGKTRAIFHVIEPLGIQLVLLNSEKQLEETVLMDKTLSQLRLVPGFWQVTGFILNGKRYQMMNSNKLFIFHIKKDQIAYVGSYIFQCPKVNKTYLKQMKKMSFFNRYPFSSDKRLCEMVVGSDFENVNRVWVDLDKEKHRPLSLGF
ncbi:MAG: hypothetical protein H0V66_11475 [Bdellovibrionales bacterium]|nr:hypothetical protein [Bdellovibrionales bacterium]